MGYSSEQRKLKISRSLVVIVVLFFLVWPVLFYIPEYFQFSSVPLSGLLWSGLAVHIIAMIACIGLSSRSERAIRR
jgi:hypothetical protein